MTDIIVEYLKQGVNLFLNSLTIVMIVGTFALVSVVSTAVRTQEAANERMAETAEFNQFTNGDNVRGSDVIAALMKYRSSVTIKVLEGASTAVNSDNVDASNYNLEYLSGKVRQEKMYKPEVIFSPNGEITEIKFTLQ